MLSAVLSLGQSAPLHSKLVLGGLATSTGALVMEQDFTLRSPGLFMVESALQADVTSEQALAMVDALLNDQLEELRGGRAAEALERARNLTQVGFYNGVRSNMGLARQLASYITATGDPLYGQHLLERMRTVTEEEVGGVLERYLLTAPRLVVAQRPGAAE